ASATVPDLEELARRVERFPEGVDSCVGRYWIINAIDRGSRVAVEWMLSRGVDLSFRDEEGVTVLHAAIDRRFPDKYEILDLLLRHGAPVNARGIYEMTPAHLAAGRDDMEALRVLVRHGAD